jgi:hypothetical protein
MCTYHQYECAIIMCEMYVPPMLHILIITPYLCFINRCRSYLYVCISYLAEFLYLAMSISFHVIEVKPKHVHIHK